MNYILLNPVEIKPDAVHLFDTLFASNISSLKLRVTLSPKHLQAQKYLPMSYFSCLTENHWIFRIDK